MPFALLTEAGWQDLDSQPPGGSEEQHLAWHDRIRGVLDTLPGDTLLTMVDCHT